MIPPEYHYTSAYLIELEERFAIDGWLAGKRISFRFSDSSYITIVVPSIIRNEQFFEVGIPNIGDYRMDVVDDWGRIENFGYQERADTLVIWISKVLVLLFEEEPSNGELCRLIQERGQKLIHALQVINPDSIRISSIDVPNHLCRVRFCTWLNTEGGYNLNLSRPTIEDDRTGFLSVSELMRAIRNQGKTISLAYELLDNARINITHNDYRAAVLNCATAIEIPLKRELSLFLDEATTSSCLKDFVLSKADSYSRQKDLCKKFAIPVGAHTDAQRLVFDIRHKVIHGGYRPTYQEATNAFQCTNKVLLSLNVPIFE